VAGPLRTYTGFLCRRRLDDVTCARVVSRLTTPKLSDPKPQLIGGDLQLDAFGYEYVNVAVATLGLGLMWANMLRAFQLGKARTSHDGPRRSASGAPM
jgi:hypothetical protein